MDEIRIRDLELKVAELEKRIKFLYEMMDKQTKVNAKLISCTKDLTALTRSCSDNTITNSKSIHILSTMI